MNEGDTMQQTRCPICGSKGQDLVFKFYCRNPLCQNYDGAAIWLDEEDIAALVRSMWEIYGIGETEEEFFDRFFSAGGAIEVDPEDPVIESARIIEPDWLRRRMRIRGL